MKRVLIPLLCAVLGGCTQWRTQAPEIVPTKYRPAQAQNGRLDNGIEWLLSPFAHPATTTVALTWRRGWAEDGATAGQAHVLAAWLELESRREHAESFEPLGADLRVTATAGTITLRVDVLHEDVEAALASLATLLESANEEFAFELARSTRVSTLRLRRRQPGALAFTALLQGALGDDRHHLASGSGTDVSLKQLTFADVKALRDALVRSTPAAWVVVGPHEQARVQAWVEAASGDWSVRRSTPPPELAHEPHPSTVTVIPLDTGDVATVMVGATYPSQNAHTVVDVLPLIRGSAHHELRTELQATYGVLGSHVDLGGVSMFTLETKVDSTDVDRAVRILVQAFIRAPWRATEQSRAALRRHDAAFQMYRAGFGRVRTQALLRTFATSEDLSTSPPFGDQLDPPSREEIETVLRDYFAQEYIHVAVAGDSDVVLPRLMNLPYVVKNELDVYPPGPAEAGYEVAPEPAPEAETPPEPDRAEPADEDES